MKRAVVLGPGGLVGTAWTVGLLAGLRETGVDLAEAELVVGTSAGAIAGAALTGGRDLRQLAALPVPAGHFRPAGDAGDAPPVGGAPLARDASPVGVGAAQLGEVLGRVRALGESGLDRAEVLRRTGEIAVEAAIMPEEVHVRRIGGLIGTSVWPGSLVVTAVDIDAGEPVTFGPDSGAPLDRAVAASCAAPGVYPPVTIGDHRYLDGGFGWGTGVALAARAGARIVIEPLARMLAEDPAPEPAVTLRPDDESAALIAALFDRSAWPSAYLAGHRQALTHVEAVTKLWHA